ncbi:hypothetical protein BT93_F3110 [Corymbia citriodora subsp. variegata]|nr:hypothetical protein BT93_F3110 [Corymbia citriodora subsp. variegata]
MDKDQEDMQFLSLFGIYKESCNIILQWRKLFAQITLALVLPLSFIFLLHMKVSDALFSEITRDWMALDAKNYDKLSDRIDRETAFFLLFKAAYFTFLLIFSLLATSAVVYTIASVYAGREVSFRKAMRVVPRVWKKLMAIFMMMFYLICIYNIGAVIFFITFQSIGSPENVRVAFYIVFGGFYLVGLVYLSMVWQLASVVAVLEEASYMGHAINKSHALIKGKIWVVSLIFLKFNLLLVLIQLGFQNLVVHRNNTISTGITSRIAFGVLCCSLLCALILSELVVQTVVYFVCKSYHHENVDKSALSDHLEGYLGEYVPLVSMDVQLEQYNV